MSVETPEQREARLAETYAAAMENRFPDPAKWGMEPGQVPLQDLAAAGADEEIFTAADLLGEQLLEYREYTIPGTKKRVFIFPLSGRDVELLSAWQGRSEWEIGEEDSDREKAAKIQAALAHVQSLQAILACYRDRGRKARCFGLQDVAAVKGKLPYTTIKEICRLSEELATGEESLGRQARAFFDAVHSFTSTVSSALSTWADCPDGLKEAVEEFGLRAQQSALLGKLQSGPGEK